MVALLCFTASLLFLSFVLKGFFNGCVCTINGQWKFNLTSQYGQVAKVGLLNIIGSLAMRHYPTTDPPIFIRHVLLLTPSTSSYFHSADSCWRLDRLWSYIHFSFLCTIWSPENGPKLTFIPSRTDRVVLEARQ